MNGFHHLDINYVWVTDILMNVVFCILKSQVISIEEYCSKVVVRFAVKLQI